MFQTAVGGLLKMWLLTLRCRAGSTSRPVMVGHHVRDERDIHHEPSSPGLLDAQQMVLPTAARRLQLSSDTTGAAAALVVVPEQDSKRTD